MTSATATSTTAPVAATATEYLIYPGRPNQQDVYEFTIDQVVNCTSGDGDQVYDLAQPLPEDSCVAVFSEAWQMCTANQGRGGMLQAGCLLYGIRTVY